jgi:hypothetical protein
MWNMQLVIGSLVGIIEDVPSMFGGADSSEAEAAPCCARNRAWVRCYCGTMGRCRGGVKWDGSYDPLTRGSFGSHQLLPAIPCAPGSK